MERDTSDDGRLQFIYHKYYADEVTTDMHEQGSGLLDADDCEVVWQSFSSTTPQPIEIDTLMEDLDLLLAIEDEGSNERSAERERELLMFLKKHQDIPFTLF